MAQRPFIAMPFPVVQNATTASPGYVRTITVDPALAAITAVVVLSRDERTLLARVYRRSTTAPGFYSSDLYRRDDGRWKRVGEERWKYQPPHIPAHAKSVEIDGVVLHTLTDVTEEEKEVLRGLLAPR